MRDCLNSRSGFDRVLMAVAATFLTVSATSAMAQDQGRSSAAELAIDAAIPRPEPANVPPPTINDFKMDTTAVVPPSAKPEAAKPETTKPETTKAVDAQTSDKPDAKPTNTNPADVATAPAVDTKTSTATPAPAATS